MSCAICLDTILSDHPVVSTVPCGHAYHEQCWETWLDTSEEDRCPLCNQDVEYSLPLFLSPPTETTTADTNYSTTTPAETAVENNPTPAPFQMDDPEDIGIRMPAVHARIGLPFLPENAVHHPTPTQPPMDDSIPMSAVHARFGNPRPRPVLDAEDDPWRDHARFRLVSSSLRIDHYNAMMHQMASPYQPPPHIYYADDRRWSPTIVEGILLVGLPVLALWGALARTTWDATSMELAWKTMASVYILLWVLGWNLEYCCPHLLVECFWYWSICGVFASVAFDKDTPIGNTIPLYAGLVLYSVSQEWWNYGVLDVECFQREFGSYLPVQLPVFQETTLCLLCVGSLFILWFVDMQIPNWFFGLFWILSTRFIRDGYNKKEVLRRLKWVSLMAPACSLAGSILGYAICWGGLRLCLGTAIIVWCCTINPADE
jgi:Ring finger domain